MNKKIIFVNPLCTREEMYAKLAKAGSLAPPLGICWLAAVTRKEGYEVKILDASILNLNSIQTTKKLFEMSPDIICLTATTLSINSAARVAKLVKKDREDIIVILGGPHITATPFETMERFPQFDIGVIGEGEITIVKLINKIKNCKKAKDLNHNVIKTVDGLIIRNKSKLITTNKRKLIDKLDELPFPAWDLLPNLIKYYRPTFYSVKRLPSTSLLTSRGCPGQCTFCDRAVFGNCLRAFSADYVIRMIKFLKKNYDIKDILFDDDTFMIFKKRLIEICNRIINEKINITWSCNSRVNLADYDILKLMKKAGCWQIAYGIESGNQRVLNFMKKGINLEQIRRALVLTKKAGIKTKGFLMMGLPSETEKEIEDTISFILSVPLDDFQINFFSPLPGTELSSIAQKYGKVEKDWSKMGMHTEESFLPYNIPRKKLVQLNKKAFRKFYLRPKVIFSYILMLRKPEDFLRLYEGSMSLLKYWLSKS